MLPSSIPLRSLNFVEAHITAMCLKEDSGVLEISFRGQDGIHFFLIAQKVDRLVVNEFREQNIVETMQLWDSESFVADYYISLIELLLGATEIEASSGAKVLIEQEINEIKTGRKIFLEIQSLYGADIRFIAGSVIICQHPGSQVG